MGSISRRQRTTRYSKYFYAHSAGVEQVGKITPPLLPSGQPYYPSGAPWQKGKGAVLMPIENVRPTEDIVSGPMGGWNGIGAAPHSDNPIVAKQIELVNSIKQSIRAGEPIEPLIVRPNGNLIEGHHRFLAFQGVNATHVPVIVLKRGRGVYPRQ